MTTSERFACRLTDEDLTRACAPEQPDEVLVGQEWMRLADGNVLPVKRVREGLVDLSGATLTIVLQTAVLRDEWVCIDPPDNVVRLGGLAEGEPQP